MLQRIGHEAKYRRLARKAQAATARDAVGSVMPNCSAWRFSAKDMLQRVQKRRNATRKHNPFLVPHETAETYGEAQDRRVTAGMVLAARRLTTDAGRTRAETAIDGG